MPTRKEILEMLSAGEIDVTRATDMLNQPGEPDAPAAAPAEPAPRPVQAQAQPTDAQRRWLHIHVSELDSGRSRVRVNVPLSLIQFGVKIGARFTDELNSDMLSDLMDVLRNDDVSGTLVEVEDAEDNERVHIYVD
jgi:hypothetical protein